MIKNNMAARLAALIPVMIAAGAPSMASAPADAPSVALGDTGTIGQTAEQQATAKLTADLRTEVAKQPATASAEDLEGVLIFVISQGNYDDAVISASLDALGQGASDNLSKAINNVRVALLKKKLKRGTGALGTGGANGNNGGGTFTPPSVSTGGGSSNYSS